MSNLQTFVNKTVTIITSEGRSLTGKLVGHDQTTNLILSHSIKRIIGTPRSEEGTQQVEQGLYLVRGIVLLLVGLWTSSWKQLTFTSYSKQFTLSSSTKQLTLMPYTKDNYNMLCAIFLSSNGKETLGIALASGAAYWVAIANTKHICRAEEEFRADLRFIEF